MATKKKKKPEVDYTTAEYIAAKTAELKEQLKHYHDDVAKFASRTAKFKVGAILLSPKGFVYIIDGYQATQLGSEKGLFQYTMKQLRKQETFTYPPSQVDTWEHIGTADDNN